MATPKGKVSKARRNSRRSAHWKLSMPGIVKCPRWAKMKLSHRVCKFCGYYDGQESEVISLHFVRPCLSKTRAHFLCPPDLPDF